MQPDTQHRLNMLVAGGLLLLAGAVVAVIAYLGRSDKELVSHLVVILSSISGGLVGFLSNQRGQTAIATRNIETANVEQAAEGS